MILYSFASGTLCICGWCCLSTRSDATFTSCLTSFISFMSVWDVFNTICFCREKPKRSDVWFEEEDELKVQWICTFFFLRNSRLGCCNVFLKRCRFWGNRLYKSLGGKSLESYDSGTYVVFIVSLLSFLHILYFFPEKEREIEGVRPRRKREGGEEKKSLLTHKLVNAVALSTFSSNENFYHLHINLISCVSLFSPPPPLPH